jgi:RNase P subunit RPR2
MTIPHGEPIVDDDYPQPFKWKEFNMETAIRHRNCNYCGNIIPPGEKCLRFRYGSSYYKITANLCRNCMSRMLYE